MYGRKTENVIDLKPWLEHEPQVPLRRRSLPFHLLSCCRRPPVAGSRNPSNWKWRVSKGNTSFRGVMARVVEILPPIRMPFYHRNRKLQTFFSHTKRTPASPGRRWKSCGSGVSGKNGVAPRHEGIGEGGAQHNGRARRPVGAKGDIDAQKVEGGSQEA